MSILTSIDKTRIIYSDIDKDMTINPVTKDITKKANENAVKESMKNLLLIDRGELPFQPQIGSNIRKLLFENLTPTTLVMMKDLIVETLENYEPRANIIDVNVNASTDGHEVYVKVIFSVINNEKPVTLDVILERVR